jgi:hypothetical protein
MTFRPLIGVTPSRVSPHSQSSTRESRSVTGSRSRSSSPGVPCATRRGRASAYLDGERRDRRTGLGCVHAEVAVPPARPGQRSPHGYPSWQRRSIAPTCAAVERLAGKPARSWRNHANANDSNTPRLLADAGIVAWSDVDLARVRPYVHETGLVVLPINTLPDHENLYHGDGTPRRSATLPLSILRSGGVACPTLSKPRSRTAG